LSGERELVQRVNNLLRATHRKGRDDDLAFAIQCVANEFADDGVGICLRFMHARAISAFDLEIIHIFDVNRIAQNIIAPAAHVSAEKITKFPFRFR